MRTMPLAATALALAMTTLSTGTGTDRIVMGMRSSEVQAADARLVARGDSVFHGKLGGAICATCHGANAKGMPGMGPDLTDKAWLHGDGSRKAIEATIRAGVAKPKQSNMAMPPFGGVPLDSAKVTAVAAYIQSLGAKQ
jgi:cbb3-type cytochrome c oxidase subunit III